MGLGINKKTRLLLQDNCEELIELLELEADKQKLKEVTERRKRQKQARKESLKRYYDKNAERENKRVTRYLKEHKEKAREASRRYYWKHIEEIKERTHTEEFRKYQRERKREYSRKKAEQAKACKDIQNRENG